MIPTVRAAASIWRRLATTRGIATVPMPSRTSISAPLPALRSISPETTSSSHSLALEIFFSRGLPLNIPPPATVSIHQKLATLSSKEDKSTLSPFTPLSSSTPTSYHLTSVKRKRRLKMNKHKLKKLRKKQRALRKRLGK